MPMPSCFAQGKILVKLPFSRTNPFQVTSLKARPLSSYLSLGETLVTAKPLSSYLAQDQTLFILPYSRPTLAELPCSLPDPFQVTLVRVKKNLAKHLSSYLA